MEVIERPRSLKKANWAIAMAICPAIVHLITQSASDEWCVMGICVRSNALKKKLLERP